MSEGRTVASVVVGFILLILLLVGSLMSLMNRLNFPGELAQIEQLRRDVVRVSPDKAEDVIGQVTNWNQKIATNKRYNELWWSDWLVPDAWNHVALIEIPTAG